MIERIIKSSSREKDIVIECFLGSGTTLIACHQTSRQCRAVEIEPKYVAITLERFSELTGCEPLLLKSYEAIQAAKGYGYAETRTALDRLIALYTAWDKPEQADQWRAKSARAYTLATPPGSPTSSAK